MCYFPIFYDLKDRPVIVVGGTEGSAPILGEGLRARAADCIPANRHRRNSLLRVAS